MGNSFLLAVGSTTLIIHAVSPAQALPVLLIVTSDTPSPWQPMIRKLTASGSYHLAFWQTATMPPNVEEVATVLVSQSFCNGSLGAIGFGSAASVVQQLLDCGKCRAGVLICPLLNFPAEVHAGGLFRLHWGLSQWIQHVSVEERARTAQRWMQLDDSPSREDLPALLGMGEWVAWWQQLVGPDRDRSIRPFRPAGPVLSIVGWHDWMLPNVLERFRSSPLHHQTLLIGPWSHWLLADDSWLDPQIVAVPGDRGYLDAVMRWFDDWLYDTRRGSDEAPPLFAALGDTWHVLDQWPPHEGQPLRLYLAPGGRLATSPPDSLDNILVNYTNRPATTYFDFLSAPWETGIDLLGPAQLTVYTRASGEAATVVASVGDVSPDGQWQWLRCTDGLLVQSPGCDVTTVTLDLGGIGHRFLPGHRLGLRIHGQVFPTYDNTGLRPTNLWMGAPLPSHLTIWPLEQVMAFDAARS